MDNLYPADYASQQAFWSSFQNEIAEILDEVEPIMVTSSTPPTQETWETAWVSAGNALPIPPGQQFIWFDGARVRGEYMVLTNDHFCVLNFRRGKNMIDTCFRADGSIIGFYQARPELNQTNPARFGDQFCGVGRIRKDGSPVNIADFSKYRSYITTNSPVSGNFGETYYHGDVPVNMIYREDNDTAYCLFRINDNASQVALLRPSAIGGSVQQNAIATAAVDTLIGDTVRWSLYLGNNSASSIGVTITVTSLAGGGEVLTSGVVTLAANQPMTFYEFSAVATQNWTNGAQINIVFNAAQTAPDYVRIWAVRVNFRYNAHPQAYYSYTPYTAFADALTGWTLTNVAFGVGGTAGFSTIFSHFVVEYNFTTDTATVRFVDDPLFAGNSASYGTAHTQISLLHVDSLGRYYLTSTSTSNRLNRISRWTPTTRAIFTVFNAFSLSRNFDRAFYYPAHDKFIINYGIDAVTGPLASEWMDVDGANRTVMANFYEASCYKGEYLYGLPSDWRIQSTAGGPSLWPGPFQRTITIWDWNAAALVSEPPLFESLAAEQLDFMPTLPLFDNTLARDTVLNAFWDYMPLLRLLPIELFKSPVADEYIAGYGNYDGGDTASSLNPNRNAWVTMGVSAFINDGGSTGKVWRISEWTAADQDMLLLEKQTSAIDEDFFTFDFANYAQYDLTNYENLLLVVDSNVITASDTITVQFNGDTGANYSVAYVRTSAAVFNKVESAGQNYIGFPAPNSALPSSYWMWLMDYKSTEPKVALMQGNQFLAVTTTNVQGLLGSGAWSGVVPITSIRISTVTAGRKLRANSVFSLYAMKTKERYSNGILYSPGMA